MRSLEPYPKKSGVRRPATAGERRKRRLSQDELRKLGKAMRDAGEEGEHPVGISAVRLMLLTGSSSHGGAGLTARLVEPTGALYSLPGHKSGAQLRVLGDAAIHCIEAQPIRSNSPFVFPADWGEGHFIGVVRVLERLCRRVKLEDVTPHVLRHTFASVAGDLGFSELTIAGLLGHRRAASRSGYVHLDQALIVAADHVSCEIARIS